MKKDEGDAIDADTGDVNRVAETDGAKNEEHGSHNAEQSADAMGDAVCDLLAQGIARETFVRLDRLLRSIWLLASLSVHVWIIANTRARCRRGYSPKCLQYSIPLRVRPTATRSPISRRQ